MPPIRLMEESPKRQGINEQIAYRVKTFPVSSGPSLPSVTITILQTGVDVSATCLSGAASIDPDGIHIITPVVKSLTAGVTYRMYVRYTMDGQILEDYGDIIGER